jgi:hypothetical protein
MNKTSIILLMGGILCVLSCGAQSKLRTQEREDFFVFFQGFCTDSSFQASRVKFPLVNVYLGADLDSVITEKIESDKWANFGNNRAGDHLYLQ